jgi:SHS family sialic acid transporter-like MFS transporter
LISARLAEQPVALSHQRHAMEQNTKLTRAQWLVLLAAFLGWLFDGFEIGLFPVVARPALIDLIGGVNDVEIGKWMGRITASFLLGAACGGLAFGWLGDRIGRTRAMALSILTYSVCTGIAYFSKTPEHLVIFRFLAALGMGGEWALGVALVMECWPEKWRPLLAGCIGAAANLGMLLVAFIARNYPVTVESWRWMFLVGASPAALVFLIRLWVPESEKWQRAAASAKRNPIAEVFSPPLTKSTLLGIALASVALIGTWGSVQWIPIWVDKLTGGAIAEAKANVQMASSIGAIIGSLLGPLLCGRFGRRPAFFFLCAGSYATCWLLFSQTHGYNNLLNFKVFLVGMFTASFYGWFPLYLPELFPTRVRATGQGVAYNSGRILAAGGALLSGQLVRSFDGDYARMGLMITLVYFVGMLVIWMAPETKGRPLPD